MNMTIRSMTVGAVLLGLVRPAAADGGATTVVHVDANPSYVTLERHVGSAWRPVCMTPCDRRVPEGEYRLAGDGLRWTRPFVVSGERAALRGDLTPHSRLPVGLALAIAGGTLIVGGGAAMLAAVVVHTNDLSGAFAQVLLFGGGAVGAAAGLALLVPAIVMLATGSSSVSFTSPPREAGVRVSSAGLTIAF